MEAVKQGAATVALKSKTHVVLCALKVRCRLVWYLNPVPLISREHPRNYRRIRRRSCSLMIISVFPLLVWHPMLAYSRKPSARRWPVNISDSSSRFMRTECINHQYAFDKPMPVTRLMDHVSNSKISDSSVLSGRANHFRMPGSDTTIWSSSLWRWLSHGWFRCMLLSHRHFRHALPSFSFC